MAWRRSGTVCAVVLTLVALAAAEPRARACAVVGGLVKIRGEEVLIAWDRVHHVEHFVRRLNFEDAAPDFGFLVPTPSRPELADVADRLFSELFGSYALFLHGGGSGVEVVEQRRVAGLDATVLHATDAHSLDGWLGAHHYPSSPALAAYLAPYVQRGYYVTAFRFAGGTHFGTRALRMSFAADVPFFPYAEPADAQHVPGRVFRISVISDGRVEGRVGAGAWAARTRFAGPLSEPGRLARLLPADAIAPHAWLTTFQEDDSARGTEDLLFVPSPNARRVAPSLTTPVGGRTVWVRPPPPPTPGSPDPLDALLPQE